mmetsp:Transcript_115180/g.332713  ORF Transcript_115180/g.332713 Transcript_115180/m.332713 type:complete len:268 (+) Transcript_115180:135-938(+)
MSITGPCGGQPGAVPRGGKAYGKGGFPSKRKMPLKGLRKGGYIFVSYKEKKAPGMIEEKVEYEGVIVDKRVGWDNRESYVELDECVRLNAEGQIVAREGRKKLFDAFIDECEEVEKAERALSPELAAAEGVNKAGGADSADETARAMMNMAAAMAPNVEAMLAMGAAAAASASNPMAPAMGMPMGCGMMPMGMMPMGMMPMGMMPMGMMGMMPMQMQMGMGTPMGMMAMPTMPGAGMCGGASAPADAAQPDASNRQARSRSRSRGPA